jgi:tetratricopeptide (TPR) repeat protein
MVSPPSPKRIEATRQQIQWCRGYVEASSSQRRLISTTDAELTIKGCTAVLQSGQWAWAFNNRGLAYIAKGEYDSAIADCTKANAGVFYFLGLAYRAKGEYPNAFRVFIIAAESGHASAANAVGLMYAMGEGIAPDYGRAVRWFDLAANQGDGAAMSNVGELLAKGQGVQKDCDSARQWVESAIAAGYEDANQNLRSGFDGQCQW